LMKWPSMKDYAMMLAKIEYEEAQTKWWVSTSITNEQQNQI